MLKWGTMSTYYDLLGVDPDASQFHIESAYQRQRESYRVDRVAGIDAELQQIAERRTAELEHVYHILSDPLRRQQYDISIGLRRQGQGEESVSPSRTTLSSRERWYALGGVLTALVLIALIWSLTDHTERPSIGEVNRPAPNFTLPELNGGEVHLGNYRGKVVLVNFWATWCEPCKRETPALQAAYKRLSNQGLMIIGVNLTDDETAQGNTESDIRSFVEQYNVTYPIALDVAGEATKAFRVFPLPTSYFIDPEGTIRYIRVGEITTDEVTALFTELQQEAAALRK